MVRRKISVRFQVVIFEILILIPIIVRCYGQRIVLQDKEIQSFYTSEGSGTITIDVDCIEMEQDIPVIFIYLEFVNTSSLVEPNVRIKDTENDWYPLFAISTNRPWKLTSDQPDSDVFGTQIIIASDKPKYDLYGYSDGSVTVIFDLSITLSIELEAIYRFRSYLTCIDFSTIMKLGLYHHGITENQEVQIKPSDEITKISPLSDKFLIKSSFKSEVISLSSNGVMDICILTIREEQTIWNFDVEKFLISSSSTKSIDPNKPIKRINILPQLNKENNGTDASKLPFDGFNFYEFQSTWKGQSFSGIFFRFTYAAKLLSHSNEKIDPDETTYVEIGLMVQKDFTTQILLSAIIMFASNILLVSFMYVICPCSMVLIYVFYWLAGKFHENYFETNEPHVGNLLL